MGVSLDTLPFICDRSPTIEKHLSVGYPAKHTTPIYKQPRPTAISTHKYATARTVHATAGTS